MALNYGTYDDDWGEDDWYGVEEGFDHIHPPQPALPIDVIALAAVILVILGLFFAIKEITWKASSQPIIQAPSNELAQVSQIEIAQPESVELSTSSAIIAPYDDYILTQGIHGLSYGHMAIDIAAGKGEPIKSPINGTVTEYFFDAIGNPTLVIENEIYRITMLHGNFTVEVGQEIKIGEPIGTEGNLGNTRDMQGRSCRGRDCGYHTHLNVFDKQLGSNINPLELIE